MILIHPRALRYFEWCRPDPRNQAQTVHLVVERRKSVGKQRCVWGRVFSTSVLVALVYVEKVVAERFQMLRFPLSVGESCALIQAKVISCPTPPSHQRWSGSSGMVNLPDQRAIGIQLVVIIPGQTKENSL